MNKQSGHQYHEEFVSINGLNQYFLYYPSSNGEVMLVIHGGPGQSEAAFAYLTEDASQDMTTVYYDQRGAGRTLLNNPTKTEDITFQQLYSDLHETVLYIKQKFNKDKIILSGHSWGSLLGITYAHEHPENLLCYIGCCQVINAKRGEKTIFNKLIELVQDDPKSLHLLQSLGDYPDNLQKAEQFSKAGSLISKIKNKLGLGIDIKKIINTSRKSPVFRLSDIMAIMKAQNYVDNLYEAMLSFSTEEVAEFQTPIYFVHGSNDWQVPIELVQEYCKSITAPDKMLYTLENAGHVIVIDDTEGSIAAIKAAISRLNMYSAL